MNFKFVILLESFGKFLDWPFWCHVVFVLNQTIHASVCRKVYTGCTPSCYTGSKCRWCTPIWKIKHALNVTNRTARVHASSYAISIIRGGCFLFAVWRPWEPRCGRPAYPALCLTARSMHGTWRFYTAKCGRNTSMGRKLAILWTLALSTGTLRDDQQCLPTHQSHLWRPSGLVNSADRLVHKGTLPILTPTNCSAGHWEIQTWLLSSVAPSIRIIWYNTIYLLFKVCLFMCNWCMISFIYESFFIVQLCFSLGWIC